MLAQTIIQVKRSGGVLSNAQIKAFVKGATDGTWSDAQCASLLMAIFLKGMNSGETAVLTSSMLESGDRLTFKRDPRRPIVDKHSTGGVGDKTSIIIAPLLASCGMRIPMISGRGLGHTGGTLDKLESIPGFSINLSQNEIQNQVQEIGFAMIGQTGSIVPADQKLYALRDETGTVESIPLITASILSKKLAESLDALVLDVKYGRGAFMPTIEAAESLANSIVATGKLLGLKTHALITEMDSPLGRMVGNSLEVIECIEFLKGVASDDLEEVVFGVCHTLLEQFEMSDSFEASMGLLKERIEDGSALERLGDLIEAQGGNRKVIDDYDLFQQAPLIEDFFHEEKETVWVKSIDSRKVGNIVMEMGAGRRVASEKINPSVGISELIQVGDCIQPGDLLARVHIKERDKLNYFINEIRGALTFSKDPTNRSKRIYKTISSDIL